MTASEKSPGSVLYYEQNLRQGSIIKGSVTFFWHDHDTADINRQVYNDAQLVVVSQACDIVSSGEPYIEATIAVPSPDEGVIKGSKIGNSSRVFMVRENKSSPALSVVADARYRVFIDKKSLLGKIWDDPFAGEEDRRLAFASWFASRYQRIGLPNNQVDAIQKPLIKALKKSKDQQLHGILEQVDELRFALDKADPPWKVTIIAIANKRILKPAEEAKINAWIESTIKDDKVVLEVTVHYKSDADLSVDAYKTTRHLQLDQFSEPD